MSLNTGPERFAAALVELDLELDWEALGKSYCEEGGEDFFDQDRRALVREGGLLAVDEIGTALVELEGPRLGRSLYVGAAVFELVPVLCEALVLEREVVALNLPSAETAELNRALAAVARKLGFELPGLGTEPLDPLRHGSFDHVWMVSVLTDPDAFPALHDHLYERRGSDLATGRGSLAENRERATALAEAVLACLARPALLTTTDEELDFLEELGKKPAAARVRSGRLTPIVGDRIRILSLD